MGTTFGNRLMAIRKEKGLSQGKLAKEVDTMGVVIGRYERGEVKPSIEAAAKLADALGVSLDFLSGLSDRQLDRDMILQMNELQALDPEDQTHILRTIRSLVRDAKARQAYG